VDFDFDFSNVTPSAMPVAPSTPPTTGLEQLPTIDFKFEIDRHLLADQTQNIPTTMGSVIMGAQMFVFTPRILDPFMQRPMTYNMQVVNGQSITGCLVENYEQYNRAIPPGYLPFGSTPLAQAVQPAAQGPIYMLDRFSDKYTFVLVIDMQKKSSMAHPYQQGGQGQSTRFIASGFFIDEPKLPSGGWNKEAILQFTHHTAFDRNMLFGGNGANIPFANTVHQDLVPIDMHSMMQGGTCNTPGAISKIATNTQFTGSSALSTDTSAMLSNHNSTHIAGYLKSPKQHMVAIGTALTSILEDKRQPVWESGPGQYPSYGNNAAHHKYSNTLTALNEILTTEEIPKLKGPAQWLDRLTLDKLVTTIPALTAVNAMQCISIPKNRQWEAFPSTYTTFRNNNAALIADSVASMCEALSIVEISCVIDTKRYEGEVRWKVDRFSTALPGDDKFRMGVFHKFQSRFNADVVPFIEMTQGPIMIILHYRIHANTLIKLHYHDYNENVDAFYEHPTPLGGMVSPALAPFDHVLNNAIELGHLCTGIDVF
jgi:hypothetical protein